MSTLRCRAENRLTCPTHGAAFAKDYFTPLGQVRNFGVGEAELGEFERQSQALKSRLPLDLRWELDSYTGTVHSDVNAYLRGGLEALVENELHENYRDRERTAQLLARVRARAQELVPVIEERVRDLDQAFALGEEEVDARVLYRTVRVWGANGANTTTAAEKKAFISEHYAPNSVVRSKAYTSTSLDSDFMLTQARRRPSQLIVLEILTGRGLALHESGAGNVQHVEREVLLPRNMNFEVLGAGHATFESSGSAPELPMWFGSIPEKKRYPVIQMREVR